ncbi:hypothetical protein OY671_007501, partial [Metschnikowia pulcherrima]
PVAPAPAAPAPVQGAPAARQEPGAPARTSAFAPRTDLPAAPTPSFAPEAPAAPVQETRSLPPVQDDPYPAVRPSAPEPAPAAAWDAAPARDAASGYGPPSPLARRPVAESLEPSDAGYVSDSVEARSDWMASAVSYEEMSTSSQGSTDFQEATLADPNDGIYQPLKVDAAASGLARRSRGEERDGYVDRFTARIDRDPEQSRARSSAFQSATARGRVEGQDETRGTVNALSTEATNFGWSLDNFVRTVPGSRHTLVVSADGSLMAMSDQLDRTSGDQLAAIVSGMSSSTRGAARQLNGGNVRQAIIEMDNGFSFLMNVSNGSVSGVVAEANCDIGLIGYEMALLVSRTEATSTPQLISEMRGSLPVDAHDGYEAATVRPYAVTGGRVRSATSDLPLEALVEVMPGAVNSFGSPPEKRSILQHAAHTYVSIAELSALSRSPLGVTKVLVADSQEDNYITVHTSTPLNVHTGHGSNHSGSSSSVLERQPSGASGGAPGGQPASRQTAWAPVSAPVGVPTQAAPATPGQPAAPQQPAAAQPVSPAAPQPAAPQPVA